MIIDYTFWKQFINKPVPENAVAEGITAKITYMKPSDPSKRKYIMNQIVNNSWKDKNFKIISVESRKGGVGKTTAALNLADLLLEKGYKVLLLDLDITGTSISGSFQNSYWGQRINPIKYNKDNKKDFNLLSFFKDHFLTGEPWPGFSTKLSGIDGARINVISSDIYTEDGELICDPRIIFDELHSFWIIEMLKHICKSFIEECSNNNGSCEDKTAIVLDNSPGYVGLGKAVHEWLADIGPDIGKFITVSSLDVQDINSCINSIIAIDSLIDCRIEAARYYHSLKQNNTNNSMNSQLPDKSKTFFNNLVTNNINDQYSYYRNLSASSSKPDETYYQSFILNKVPPEIQSRTFRYNAAKVFQNDHNKENIYYKFTGNNLEPKNCIYYDNLVHFQFVEPYIEKSKVKTNKILNLKKYFTRIKNIIDSYSDIQKKENNENNILKSIDEYERLLSNLLIKLSNASYENIVQLIKDVWRPIAPLNNLLKVIDDNEGELEQYITFQDVMYKISSYLEKEHIENIYFKRHNATTRVVVLDNNEQATKVILDFLLSQRLNREIVQKFINSMRTLQHLLLKNSNLSLEQITKSISYKYMFTSSEQIDFQELQILYTRFNYAQQRIENINEDYRFLIDVLKKVSVDNDDSNYEIFPNIRDILDDVIVNRNISYSDGFKKLSKALNSAKYMSNFRKVLEENVINKWHL